ncbi:FapA family protein [Butyrivibrio sp. DSM 10294]|uniref:DUF342 domain-containing protein n=1 Tax=Butyrivibrio sp. DSM 10294 TaxID=2972457 RepID=UPI00234E6B93|nr:FapA family protein [Butyrivibrio sp. DSM 10294]MDC7293933.1 FapA family protein [Butyrivibrio sp. DSM 10294]
MLPEMDMIDELNTNAGLDSFDDMAYQKELELCKKVGADVEKLKALKFNALQLSEIRKGITQKVDVTKYFNPQIPWTAMEEMRLEMHQKVDMSEYRKQGFDTQQLSQIRQGILDEVDVSTYAKKEYFADQMKQIRLGLSKTEGVPVIFYLDPAFNSQQMREIRKALQAGIDISGFARVEMPYLKMRAIRKAAEDGLNFDQATIDRYNASILNQMHQAFVENIDISSYIQQGFDEEQLEQVRISLKEILPIDRFITSDMRGDAIREIRFGLEAGIQVAKYADPAYGWQQMKEMRLGLEHQIDITPYCNPYYHADQMFEIRMGIEEGLDISKYSSLMYTARDMYRIRQKLLDEGAYLNAQAKAAGEKGEGEQIFTKLEGRTVDDRMAEDMLVRRDEIISVESNNMICYMTLPLRRDGAAYTEKAVLGFLTKAKVAFGIDYNAIADVVKNKKIGHKFVAAVGKQPVNGEDGYYEYFFDTSEMAEPTILKDGTADLSNIEMLRQIKVGDKVARYHKATKGEEGYDVFGKELVAKPGKEIPILKGTGFMILNDRVTYVATLSGSIRMEDGEVHIQKLIVLPEVNITDKKIKYDGTVYVTGNVNSGSEIEATGDVLVGGHMESSDIISGGNVIIIGGCTCPLRGGVDAKGNVSAKYFEGATVKGRNITANFFINCEIFASGLLKTYGRAGIIYGGTANALYGMEVAHLGNKSGAKTIVNIGVNNQILTRYNAITKELSREEDELSALDSERIRIQEVGAGDKRIMQWKIKINAAYSAKELKIKELKEKKAALEDEIGKGRGARVLVTEVVYAGTYFIIAGIRLKIEEDRKAYGKLTFKADIENESIVAI